MILDRYDPFVILMRKMIHECIVRNVCRNDDYMTVPVETIHFWSAPWEAFTLVLPRAAQASLLARYEQYNAS